jgi:hypothetical protein
VWDVSHVTLQYKGFSVCEKCDIILCPANSLDECKEKPVGGAMEYIDRLKSKGMPVANAKRDAELVSLQETIEQLRAEVARTVKSAEEQLALYEGASKYHLRENARLREALERVCILAEQHNEDYGRPCEIKPNKERRLGMVKRVVRHRRWDELNKAVATARATLGEKK